MLQLIITVVLCFFAAIGMAHTYNRYISVIFREEEKKHSPPSFVFTVKNRQDDIEAVLRSFIWKISLISEAEDIMRITVVDFNSEDETMSILKRLEEEYGFLNIYDKQSYINKIEHEL